MYDSNKKEKHIADIYNPMLGVVIEFQNSPIALKEIEAREKFYKKMLWVVKVDSFSIYKYALSNETNFVEKSLTRNGQSDYREQLAEYKRLNKRLSEAESYMQYAWYRRRKIWDSASSPVFLDLGDELVWMKSEFIIKKVPMTQFLKKYGQQF